VARARRRVNPRDDDARLQAVTGRPRDIATLPGRMAQQLWLLRHGEAVPHDLKPDFDRELTDRGREQARAAGRARKALDVEIHVCFTSPKVRARETAELACAELGTEPVV